MRNKSLVAGCVLGVLLLSVGGCGDRKGDLGLERLDSNAVSPVPPDSSDEQRLAQRGAAEGSVGAEVLANESGKAERPAEAVAVEAGEVVQVADQPAATPAAQPTPNKEEPAPAKKDEPAAAPAPAAEAPAPAKKDEPAAAPAPAAEAPATAKKDEPAAAPAPAAEAPATAKKDEPAAVPAPAVEAPAMAKKDEPAAVSSPAVAEQPQAKQVADQANKELAAAPAVAAAAGLEAGKEGTKGEGAAPPAEAAPKPKDDDQPKGDGAEKKEESPKPAPAAGEEGKEARAERLLKEAEGLRSLNDQQQAAKAAREFQAGKALYDDLQYEQARVHLENVLQLDRGHAAAAELLGKVRSALGVRTDRIAVKIRELDHEYRVKIQESIVAVGRALDEARQFELKGSTVALENEESSKEDILAIQMRNLREAQDRYRRVREIINYLPPQIDLPEERKQVEEGLQRVLQKVTEREDEVSFLRRLEAQKVAQLQRERETEIHEARIKSLLEQVEDLYNRGLYSAAESLALRILQLDPFNGEAEGWKSKARQAAHASHVSFVQTQDKEERVRVWEVVEATHIPYSQLLTYPPNWDVISRRSEGAAIGGTKTEPQWKGDIRKKLQRTVSFEFVDTPLDEAIAFLRNLVDVTIIIDPKVMEGGVPPINLRVTDMKLELALEWILQLANLGYTLKDKAIYIGKKESIAEDVELRIYDVSDLTLQIPDFPGPEFQIQAVDEDAPGAGPAPVNPFANQGGAGGAEQVTPESIENMIKNRIKPDSWDAAQGTSIEQRGGRLVVMQRPEVHELINRLLDNFRATQKIMVNIESRFLTIREAYLEDIGVEFQGLDPNVLYGDYGDVSRALGGAIQPRVPGGSASQQGMVPFPGITNGPDNLWQGLFSQVGTIVNSTLNFASNQTDTISGQDTNNTIRQSGLSAQVTILNNAQVQAFVRALAVRENTTTLVAPRLTVFNTQRAHMFVARQQSYVADYEISGDSYDPTIRQFLVGVVLDVRPTVSSDRKYVTLEMRPTVTELVNFATRQIDSFTINQGAAVSVLLPLSFPIQFPELRIQRVRTTATVPDGGILLLAGLMRNVKFNAENGVPFLSDLPVVGRLFRWNVVDNARSNLAILVSPTIILFNEHEEALRGR